MMKAEDYFRGIDEAEHRAALGLPPKKPVPPYQKRRLESGCVLYQIGPSRVRRAGGESVAAGQLPPRVSTESSFGSCPGVAASSRTVPAASSSTSTSPNRGSK